MSRRKAAHEASARSKSADPGDEEDLSHVMAADMNSGAGPKMKRAPVNAFQFRETVCFVPLLPNTT